MTGQQVPPSPNELLNAALSYAAAGLKVYPVFIRGLKPDGKKDVHVPIRSWAEMATDDLDQVRAWWDGQYAGAGIGVDMGRSHLAVADADMHADGLDGLERLTSELADTPWRPEQMSFTPGGGVHVWYRDPDGTVGTGSKLFSQHGEPTAVDGRGVGGTIFMVPTYVPGYGRYRWGPDGAPDWSALPIVPEKLAAACPPGGRKKERAASSVSGSAQALAGSPFGTPSTVGSGSTVVHRDRPMTRAQAQERLLPLWERVRDTRSPNGLWQAVADFTRAVAHYPCFWDQTATEALLLAAYEAGGHGYTSLDGGDLRAIAGGIARQREARNSGDLDEGWVALARPDAAEAAAAVTTDAVEALLAEMLTPDQIKERPPRRYLIKELINLNSITWIIGAPGSRKSFVALDMAGHVAAGREWQGRKVTQGSVVIIAAEGGPGMGERIKAWEIEHGVMPGTVRTLPRPIQVADFAAWAVLVEACRRLAPVMVIVDTQARSTVGLEENSAKDMGIVVDALSAIERATGAAVVPIHHTGRNGGDARGSSALDGAQDTELKVVACTEALTGELRVEKQKDLREVEPIPLRFKIHKVGIDMDGDPLTSLALADPTPWDAAEAAPVAVEPGQELDVPEPELWTWQVYGHNRGDNARRILQVLRTLGGQEGLTKSEVERNVRARWYGGRPIRSKMPEHLDRKTWDGSWTRALELEVGQERVLFNPRGEKWAINLVALKQLPNPDNAG